MAKFKKIIKKNTEKLLVNSFLNLFIQYSKEKERLNKRFSFVLTGGKSPIQLYKNLSKIKINWGNIDFFWGDERYVAQQSKYSNFKLAQKYLFKNIKIKLKQIYFVDTKKKNVFLSSLDYEKKIKKYFNNKKINFDLILLGMGNDGHIASIFPDQIKIKTKRIVTSVIRNDFKRISLSLKTINSTKNIFLWLNNKTKSLNFNKNKKNINRPVNYLNKRKTSIFSL